MARWSTLFQNLAIVNRDMMLRQERLGWSSCSWNCHLVYALCEADIFKEHLWGDWKRWGGPFWIRSSNQSCSLRDWAHRSYGQGSTSERLRSPLPVMWRTSLQLHIQNHPHVSTVYEPYTSIYIHVLYHTISTCSNRRYDRTKTFMIMKKTVRSSTTKTYQAHVPDARP